MPKILSKPIRKKRFTAMLDKFAGGAIALFFAYIVAASTGNTSESMEALSASTISIFILLFYKFMLFYDSVEKPEKESAPLSIMYHAALIIPLITFLLILCSINPWLSKLAFVIFLICFAFLIAHFLHGYKEEKNVVERISTPNESNKKIAKRADEKFFPYIIFVIGLLYGLGFAIDWNIQVGGLWDVSFKTQFETEKSAWDIVAAIGSLLAGLATAGLLGLAWFKGSEWIRQVKASKRLDVIVLELNNLCLTSEAVFEFIDQELGGAVQSDTGLMKKIKRLKEERLSANQFTEKVITLTNKIWPHMSTLLAVYSSSKKYSYEFSQLGKAQGELLTKSKIIFKIDISSNENAVDRMIDARQQAKSIVELARSLQFLIVSDEISEN